MERLEAFQPNLVGFTAFTNEIKPSAYLAALVKERFPDAVTIVGGAHVTAIPIATLNEFPTFDLVAIGEGEATLHELCESLHTGTDFREVPGLAYRRVRPSFFLIRAIGFLTKIPFPFLHGTFFPQRNSIGCKQNGAAHLIAISA